MTMSYKNLPDHTRVWVYQCNRALNKKEVAAIKEQGTDFIQKWSAHGAQLNADFEIFYNQFIVLFVDEEQAKATGCSIDKSVRFIKSLEREFDISLLDRNQVAYQDDSDILTCTREQFIDKMRRGLINDNTIVFNNLVGTKKEFETKWKMPLKNSWHYELIDR